MAFLLRYRSGKIIKKVLKTFENNDMWLQKIKKTTNIGKIIFGVYATRHPKYHNQFTKQSYDARKEKLNILYRVLI